jgi:D-sedoheptulose 7-phosphate isomerase
LFSFKKGYKSDNALLLFIFSLPSDQCYQQNGHLFAMGNGGSSCDAAHITTEFMHPVTTGRKALSFTNLTADIATMTAVANDVGNAHIFLRQLLCLARKNDQWPHGAFIVSCRFTSVW